MPATQNWQKIYLPEEKPVAIPLRSLALSAAALAIPVIAAVFFPEWTGAETGLLIWLTALVPAFLLTYYRGWSGASLALALGMAVLSITQVVLLLAGVSVANWSLLLGLILVYIGVSLSAGWTAELLHQQRRQAEQMALTDQLTQLPNRRHAVVFLDAAFAAAARGMRLAIVLFDIDGFKDFNDRYGRVEGDEALIVVGETLVRLTRRMNLSSRFGGEEFLCVLSDCDVEGARVFAERVCSEVQELTRWENLTISAGIARYHESMSTPDRLVSAADQALYAAKGAGKNCVRIAPEMGRLEDTGLAAATGDEPPPSSP
jgi:diguanylate cyclase (GGDEF)-like protein